MDEWVTLDRIKKVLEEQQKSVGTLTRNQKRKLEPNLIVAADPALQLLEIEHEEATKIKNINTIEFGRYLIDAWYFSPYPDEYSKVDKLYICSKCLKYMKLPETMEKHVCKFKIPGTVVYEKDGKRVYKVIAEDNLLFCQNLCLLAKLFLDHKAVYYDVSSFIFFVVTVKVGRNYEIAGYFSKEEDCDFNLSCIMVLPPHQKKGLGKFLIELSYEISKLENKPGTPEKPLSDLGLRSYKSFWACELLRAMKNNPHPNLLSLSKATGFRQEDIISTLTMMNLIKHWKGEYIVIPMTTKIFEDLAERFPIKEKQVDSSLLEGV